MVFSMETDLEEFLENICHENDDIKDLIIVSEEGLPIAIASSISGYADQTLVSGMCTALNCIGRELIHETKNSTLKRMLVDCTDGAILIQPLNQKGILVASCKDASVLSELDVTSIQEYFTAHQNQLAVM
jgi:predicted regulator of Ras-like GTPase activity (Roadblock/LC7/MglB family)